MFLLNSEKMCKRRLKDDIRRWHGVDVDVDVDVLFLGAWSSNFKSGDPKKKKKGAKRE